MSRKDKQVAISFDLAKTLTFSWSTTTSKRFREHVLLDTVVNCAIVSYLPLAPWMILAPLLTSGLCLISVLHNERKQIKLGMN